MKNVQKQENEQCVHVSRTSSTNSVGNCNKTQNKCKTCNELVQFLVIRCSAIELHAQNLWGTTGFEPAFPDLKTDQLTAVIFVPLLFIIIIITITTATFMTQHMCNELHVKAYTVGRKNDSILTEIAR